MVEPQLRVSPRDRESKIMARSRNRFSATSRHTPLGQVEPTVCKPPIDRQGAIKKTERSDRQRCRGIEVNWPLWLHVFAFYSLLPITSVSGSGCYVAARLFQTTDECVHPSILRCAQFLPQQLRCTRFTYNQVSSPV